MMFWLLLAMVVNLSITVINRIYRISHPTWTRTPTQWAISALEQSVWIAVILYAMFNWI